MKKTTEKVNPMKRLPILLALILLAVSLTACQEIEESVASALFPETASTVSAASEPDPTPDPTPVPTPVPTPTPTPAPGEALYARMEVTDNDSGELQFRVCGIDAKGSEVWSQPWDSCAADSPLAPSEIGAFNGRFYWVTNGTLHCVRERTGYEEWDFGGLRGRYGYTGCFLEDGTVILCAREGLDFIAIDPKGKERIHHEDLSGGAYSGVTSVAPEDGYIAVYYETAADPSAQAPYVMYVKQTTFAVSDAKLPDETPEPVPTDKE